MKKSITVLGIYYRHDSGAALVRDGEVVAAVNEDKFSNIKHYEDYPIKSIEEVFKISKIDPSEVDVIAITGASIIKFKNSKSYYPDYLHIQTHWSWLSSHPVGLTQLEYYHNRFCKIHDLKKTLSKLEIPLKQVIIVEHHLAHAATAYHLSPWKLDDKILVLTADGAGDGISATVNIGQHGKIERLPNSETWDANSLGNIYNHISGFLGLRWLADANKVMNLAPYGKPEKLISQIQKMIAIDKNNPLIFKDKISSVPYMGLQKKVERLLPYHRFDNIAAAMQQRFESLILQWVKNAIKETGIRKIACAGGNFLNVKANQKILALDDVDDAFFCPGSGNDGLAVGTALHGYFTMAIQDGITPKKVPLTKPYFGPSFTNEEIKESLKRNNLLEKSHFIDDIDSEVGELITKPEIVVARFNGRMEWGPRALGNRSILANPSNLKMIRKLNFLKNRMFWMPFAPSILKTRMNDYLINPTDSPYMILSFDTTEERNELSSAIHPYDFSCRPQTVDSNYNPEFEKVLKTFEAKTGIGGILNTSFNMEGCPIVYGPESAIQTFTNSELQYLAIGNYLVKK